MKTFVLGVLILISGYSLDLLAKDSEGLLNRLLAPGPLIEGHKNLEGSKCLDCHDAGQGVPNEKCLTCHKEITPFVSGKKGFHGLTQKTCMECHADHKGREFDTMKIDQKTFDHKETGYILEGKHAEIDCLKCHIEKRSKKMIRKTEVRYFGKQTTCVACHKKDDVHFFKKPFNTKDCKTCHGLKKWNLDIKFDHLRDARYKLEEKHAELKCAACHISKLRNQISSKYKWPELQRSKCLTCHQDFHTKNLQPKYRQGRCDHCHTQATWKLPQFNHSKVGYPLKGKHSQIKCTDCHKPKSDGTMTNSKFFQWAGLSQRCLSCHSDFHIFGNFTSVRLSKPNNCLTCHNEEKWKPSFNFEHDRHTRFVVDGEHEELKCSDCHLPWKKKAPKLPNRPGIYLWKELTTKTCENCHKSPHIGVFSKELLKRRCTECHTTRGWNLVGENRSFDHSKTRFPITGAHRSLKCNDCHIINKKQVFKFKSVEQKFCIDCHTNVHIGQLSKKQTERSCADCHTTSKWIDRLEFDHTKTNFQIKGEHTKLKCAQCHIPTDQIFNTKQKSIKSKFYFPELGDKTCTPCHSDFHAGQLSNRCATCHSESGWKQVRFNHTTQSRFPLRGKHESIKCEACHKPTNKQIEWSKKSVSIVRYKPIRTNCIECHKDPHEGRRGNRCVDCHTEKGWRTTVDFHRNFTLSGVHYTLNCVECHQDNRKLAGMSENCFMCHQKDDIHNGALPNCGQCHKQQFWENTTWRHAQSGFPLRGTHRTLDCVQCHAQGMYKGTPSTCVACHLTDALAVTSPDHALYTNLNSCTDCHRNHFNFKSN